MLPLLGTVLTALSPEIQKYLVQFVTTHPAWSTVVVATGAIFNHWMPSPGALPSAANVAKSSLSLFLCAALIVVPIATTGCTYSQAQTVAAVQRVEGGLKTAKALLPQAQMIVGEVRVLDPDIAGVLQPLVDGAGPALDKLTAACDTYLANPGADAYQALLNGADAFTAQVDQAALATLKIKNPIAQQKASMWIALFSTGLHVTLGILQQHANSKQVKAMPKIAHVSRDEMRQFLNRDYARQELLSMGYKNPDAAIAAAGF
ncbi:MAG: hypothetical protein LAO20_14305 [Acidobacteriia bacterium]|nr:hypothetical protein [Terriglobia bacterium]